MRKKHESSHPKEQHESTGGSRLGVFMVLFCFLGIMPVLVWLTIPPSSTYVSVTSASTLIQTAAYAAGLQICTANAVTIKMPGAENGILYNLSKDCAKANSGNTVQILSVGFSSSEAQANAIQTAQSTFKNWQVTNTEAFTDGYNVIVVKGPPGDPAVQQIGNSLLAQGAQQIT